jgi:quercetin dioxygenase-like cupin family protein
MASQGTWFENPNVGQRSRIVTLPGETGGRQFVLEYINEPFAGEHAVPPHVHTGYLETFEILKGRARYRLGSETRTAVAGERVVMPPRVPHVHPWSDSAEELHVLQFADANPADLRGLNASLQAAITIQALAKAGRVNAKGLPNLLQLGVLIEMVENVASSVLDHEGSNDQERMAASNRVAVLCEAASTVVVAFNV